MDIDSPASPSHLNSSNDNHLHRPHFLHSHHNSQKSSIPNHILNEIDPHDNQIIESPSFLPIGTFKTKGKSRPDLLHFKSSAFKRPLSPSLSIDSPTTSLAADLSQNFHIEQNNQNKVPTPKRSLFPMKHINLHGIDDKDTENMDCSPLITKDRSLSVSSEHSRVQPLRKPFSILLSSRGSSTSSLATTTSFLSSSSSISSSLSTLTTSSTSTTTTTSNFPIYNDNNPIQRRAIRRAYSSTTNSHISNRNTSLINGSLIRPSMGKIESNKLDSFCVPSPILEKVTPSTENFINLVSDRDSDSENDDSPSLKREVGSPIQQRMSSKIKSTRTKVRRTHSMFQNSKDYMSNDKMATSLINRISTNMTLLSFNNEHSTVVGNATLPKTNIKSTSDSKNLIPRIDVEELVNILDGKYSEFFDKIIIIDCRFEYEFKGGHIDGAINISSQSDLEQEFLNNDRISKFPQPSKTLLIFHCEFSSYRGPLMANHLRKTDRVMNSDNYPNLHYPDILILEGGYKNFYELQSHRCLPNNYVLMNDSKHQESCEIQMHRVRRDSKLQNSRGGLKKAKSFHVSMTNSSSLHMRSKSQTFFQMASSVSTSNIPTTTTTSNSLFNRNSMNSISSLNSPVEFDEYDSEGLGSCFSNKDSDGITSFFDSQTSSNTLSSLLEDSKQDFKFPLKIKNSNHQHNLSTSSTGSIFKLSDALKDHHHQDTPIISHKKQKSSSHLYRAMTQPNLKF